MKKILLSLFFSAIILISGCEKKQSCGDILQDIHNKENDIKTLYGFYQNNNVSQAEYQRRKKIIEEDIDDLYKELDNCE